MPFQLIDRAWRDVLLEAARGANEIQIICPFIKESIIRDLIGVAKPKVIRVITRLNSADFFQGVSDIRALQFLSDQGARVKAVRGLHSKVYVFDRQRAIITSANLTSSAMDINQEFGALSTDAIVVSGCLDYFERQWSAGGADVTRSLLNECEAEVNAAKASGARVVPPGLKDHGHHDGGNDRGQKVSSLIPSASFDLSVFQSPPSSFVKFFGTADNRAKDSVAVIDEIQRSGSHWACTSSQPHRQPVDGSVMFLTRMMTPRDNRIYGMAIAQQHRGDRDIATPADIALRPWKSTWPCYVRVHRAKFIAGTLANGISLNEMMDELEHDAFESTQRNFKNGSGTTNPRETMRQAHSRKLSTAGHEWLLHRFEVALGRYGSVPEVDLAKLDWPSFER